MTSRPFTPRPYQEIMIQHLVDNPRAALWVPMGLGKGSATLTALMRLSLVEKDIFPVLIIAPLRVANSTWPDEIAKWQEFSHLKVACCTGDVKKRLAALASGADVITCNYEQLIWLVDHYKGKWPFKTVVADESSKLAGFRLRQGTKSARALAQVAHTCVKRFVALTGTPAGNGLTKTYGQLYFLDRGERLGRTFSEFSNRFFTTDYSGFNLIPLPTAQKEIQDRIKDLCLSLNAADHFDLKEPIINVIKVALPPKAREHYREIEREFFTIIENEGVEAVNAATKMQKMMQFASGFAYVGEDAKEWKEIHDVKVQALESIIEEAAGAPVLVAYNFRADLERLMKRFPQAHRLGTDPKTIRDWNAGKIPVLFAHAASAGHGLNLADGGNILVFFGFDFNMENHLQILERLGPTRQLQAGYNRPVFLHYIVAEKTVDELILERLKTKRSVQDILLEALKHRKAA